MRRRRGEPSGCFGLQSHRREKSLWPRERPERESYFRMMRRSIAAAESRGAQGIVLRRTRKLHAQLGERRAGTGQGAAFRARSVLHGANQHRQPQLAVVGAPCRNFHPICCPTSRLQNHHAHLTVGPVLRLPPFGPGTGRTTCPKEIEPSVNYLTKPTVRFP
jgi:ATP-dependent helicase YprA (DUF1998 family)